MYFVQQSSFQVLLSGICATQQHDIFATCRLFCLFKGTFDAFCNKVICCTALLGYWFPGFMTEHKYRHMECWIFTPGTDSQVEHPAAHDTGSQGFEFFHLIRFRLCGGLTAEPPVVKDIKAC